MVGKIVLLLGGSGTLSNALIPLLRARKDVAEIRLFARNEHRLVETAARHITGRGRAAILYRIGDVKDERALLMACQGVDEVIHAAAMKRVETCSQQPEEAIAVNVMGTLNAVFAAGTAGVKKFMAISSDKAVAPLTCYGKTKALLEDIVLAAGRSYPDTVFSCARYGNILSSRGSVAELWQQQAAEGVPFSVTDPAMTRFFWTVDAAARYILARMDEMNGGEIFVPRLKSATVLDLLRALHGEDAKYAVVPVREGEKMHEAMRVEGETRVVSLPDGIYSSDLAPRLSADELREMAS